MKQNSTNRRLVEALYDLDSGQTFVRHPGKEGEWLECALLAHALKGRPMASVSSELECDVYASAPHGRKETERKTSMLVLTSKGSHSELT